jgi:mRNA interferase RelE/StbE
MAKTFGSLLSILVSLQLGATELYSIEFLLSNIKMQRTGIEFLVYPAKCWATIYFDAEVHRALRLRAAACNRSISDMVNEAVRLTLAEDVDDFRDADQRQAEPSAAKEPLSVSDKATLTRLIEKVRSLSTQPRPSGSEKLAGRPNLFRVHQDNSRVIYSVDDETRVVDVVKVGHRRDVYR